MASNLRVDTILPSNGTNVAIGTASGTVSLIGDSNLSTSGNLTIGGNLGVGGVLTYEDVTNVDSVGVITARTDINIGDSIIHIGDTNTKIRFPSADTITAETGGSERLRINSSGQVSVGTATPQTQAKLQVVGNIGATQFYTTSTSSPQTDFTSSIASNKAGLLLRRSSETNGDYGGLEFHNHPSSITSYRKGGIYFQSDGSGFGRGDIVFCNDGAGDANNLTISDEKMRIHKEGHVTKPNQPGFGASNMNGWTTTTGSTYAVTSYGTVHHNYGNHFNSSNGRFTAPVDGRYFMHAIGMGVNTSSPHIAFGINNSSNGGGPSRGGTDYGNNNVWSHPTNSGYWVCITHIFDLSANDYVRVYTYDWNSSNDPVRCYFYGYLLG